MPWSTSQLADLAGTTVKAVRHYHRIGLLDEPERTANGYKQYGVRHLLRLLRITRLTALDVPLAQIAEIGQAEAEPEKALRLLDAELAGSIERLQRVRAELALIFHHPSSTDLPPGFGPVAHELSTADRALLLIYSRVLAPQDMLDIQRMVLDRSADPTHRLFDTLHADADDATRQNLAERYAPLIRETTRLFPGIESLASRAPRGAAFANATLGRAVTGLYNAAQLDVLRRAMVLLQPEPEP